MSKPDGAKNDNFGHVVAISEDAFVVGAHRKNKGRGAAYVYRLKNNKDYEVEAKLQASDGKKKDFFGISVAFHKGTILIGAQGTDDLGSASGATYVFKQSLKGDWKEVEKILAEKP